MESSHNTAFIIILVADKITFTKCQVNLDVYFPEVINNL